MSVCMHMGKCMRKHILCMGVCISTWYVHLCVGMCICTRRYLYVITSILASWCVCVCVCVCIHASMCMHICFCTSMHISVYYTFICQVSIHCAEWMVCPYVCVCTFICQVSIHCPWRKATLTKKFFSLTKSESLVYLAKNAHLMHKTNFITEISKHSSYAVYLEYNTFSKNINKKWNILVKRTLFLWSDFSLTWFDHYVILLCYTCIK
jgi:hypothetical protein